MDMDQINYKLMEMKHRGEINGNSNNFKVTKRDGITQPELLETTGD